MSEQETDAWGGSPDQKDNSDQQKGFEDNFVWEHLPDHSEYLEKLHKKLQKLQKSTDLSQSLADRRRDENRRLLVSNAIQNTEHEEEISVEINELARRLFPEKQALSLTELVRLVEADALQPKIEEEEEKKD